MNKQLCATTKPLHQYEPQFLTTIWENNVFFLELFKNSPLPPPLSPVHIYCFTGFHKYPYVDMMAWLLYRSFIDLSCHHLLGDMSTLWSLLILQLHQYYNHHLGIQQQPTRRETKWQMWKRLTSSSLVGLPGNLLPCQYYVAGSFQSICKLPYFSDYKTHFFPRKMWPKIDLRLIRRG